MSTISLDESIRDVIVDLNDPQKADVLLHALQHLPIQGCRTTVIEFAVQSLLKVPGLSPANVTRALLLRAKRRLAAGYRTSGQQDLNSVLKTDPENRDVMAIIRSQHPPEMHLREPGRLPRFSVEVWREIALFLPRRDLRSLLLVPNALSRIASELLFRDISLHLTSTEPGGRAWPTQDQDINAWHLERSADILARIFIDAQFAARVRSLSIFAISSNVTHTLAFHIGMLINTLPRLLNLRKALFSGNAEFITRMLQTVHSCNPRLQSLSIVVIGHNINIQVPVFGHLEQFMISSDGSVSNSSSIHAFLAESHDSLRSLSIDNPRWRFPAEVVSTQHLTQIEFQGSFTADTQAFSEILANGHQLESLMLSGTLECTPAALFRQYRTALPFLRHFALTITTLPRHIIDRDLCPAISDFLYERSQLQTYRLCIPPTDAHRVGFDSSSWGVLSALSELTSLSITYPSDLSPGLAGWLVPRAVRALTLDLRAGAEDSSTFMNHLRVGAPPQLRYLSIKSKSVRSTVSIVKHGFPNVRVLRVNNNVWTVTRSGEDVGLEEWSSQRIKYYSMEWLESLGCADAIWRGVGHSDYTWWGPTGINVS